MTKLQKTISAAALLATLAINTASACNNIRNGDINFGGSTPNIGYIVILPYPTMIEYDYLTTIYIRETVEEEESGPIVNVEKTSIISLTIINPYDKSYNVSCDLPILNGLTSQDKINAINSDEDVQCIAKNFLANNPPIDIEIA